MRQYPNQIAFKYPWRNYQQKILDELESALVDRHLHIIAPPGSGKTVLGLEVAKRINQPTLILVPTLAIRNQWVQRFCSLFLGVEEIPSWISTNIRAPQFLTVATYQGLHAAFQQTNSSGEELIQSLRAHNIQTIVVDEAHHLKNEWWKTLFAIKTALDPIVVGLTATPPYDVSYKEWERYIALNGAIDMEISIPELVVEKNLCPHQDLVYLTAPTEEENVDILAFRQRADEVFDELKSSNTLITAIEQHPFWDKPESCLEQIYADLLSYSACLVFLHANGREITAQHLKIIGGKRFKIPSLNKEWMIRLLDFYLHKEGMEFDAFEEHRQTTSNLLKRNGILSQKTIDFYSNRTTKRTLAASISKLGAIAHIVDFEYKQQAEKLRLVVLTDYIHKEFIVKEEVNYLKLDKIGVIPIFEQLRRSNTNGKRIGVLTGSIVIIPQTALPRLVAAVNRRNIDNITTVSLAYDQTYVQVNITAAIRQDIVEVITEIFEAGEIEVLIGTKALLGEGWDAPSVNALVLASFVGSFVLSNQMRGRAIRTLIDDDNKTANIWHIVCVDNTAPDGGNDFDVLQRRFKSFVGLSIGDSPVIENGIDRLGIGNSFASAEWIEEHNERTFSVAKSRTDLQQRWERALKKGVRLVEEIKIPFAHKRSYKEVKAFYLSRTVSYFVLALGVALLEYFELVLDIFAEVGEDIARENAFWSFVSIVSIIAVVLFGRRAYKALKLYIKYRDISKDIHQIGKALVETLVELKVIQTPLSALHVFVAMDEKGAVYVHLVGGTRFEQSTFIQYLEEITNPITNPKYILVRKSSFLGFWRKDYHAVPEYLGKKKVLAKVFEKAWQKHVGSCELVFTRTIEGRELLLHSRLESLSAQFLKKVEHVSKWEM